MHVAAARSVESAIGPVGRAEARMRDTHSGDSLALAVNSQLPTPNSQLPPPKSQLPPPKSQLPSPKSQVPTPNSQVPTPKSQLPIPISSIQPFWELAVWNGELELDVDGEAFRLGDPPGDNLSFGRTRSSVRIIA